MIITGRDYQIAHQSPYVHRAHAACHSRASMETDYLLGRGLWLDELPRVEVQEVGTGLEVVDGLLRQHLRRSDGKELALNPQTPPRAKCYGSDALC